MKAIYLQELFYRPEFRAAVQFAVLNWLGYWTGAGTDTLPTEQKADTDAVIAAAMGNTDILIDKVMKLVVNDSEITALGCYHELTDPIVDGAVIRVFGSKIKHLK